MSEAPTDSLTLELRDVRRTYPGEVPVHAVRGVSFGLPRGAFAALVGPSGSGKTTLLNLCSGLDRPSAGEVLIAGRPLARMSQTELCEFRRSSVGFVFQAYNLFPVLTAVENVEFTSVIRGDNPARARKRALDALATVGLAEKAASLPRQLSGGQQQRVAVARAIATEPAIVFADEPTANLDSRTAGQLIELFEELNRTLRVTFLFSTHDGRLLERIPTRLEMRDGELLTKH